MAVAASSWDAAALTCPLMHIEGIASNARPSHQMESRDSTLSPRKLDCSITRVFHVFFGMKSIRLLENYRDSNGAKFGCILVKHIKITSFNQKCFRTHQILFVVFFLFHFSSCGLFSRCAFAEDHSHGTFVFCQRHCQDF